ncbi:hypothetical protein RYX36_006127 [Vicia faba]
MLIHASGIDELSALSSLGYLLYVRVIRVIISRLSTFAFPDVDELSAMSSLEKQEEFGAIETHRNPPPATRLLPPPRIERHRCPNLNRPPRKTSAVSSTLVGDPFNPAVGPKATLPELSDHSSPASHTMPTVCYPPPQNTEETPQVADRVTFGTPSRR